MLNACNARFLNPRLVYATGTTAPASTEPNPNIAGPALIQIGTEGGFLPGSVFILYNDAPAPFPMGDARYDFDLRNPKTPAAAPGYGPNTRTLLQIPVMPTDPFSIPQTPGVATPNPPNINVR